MVHATSFSMHILKNAGLFQHKFGSYMKKTKCWVKNAIQVESKSWSWVKNFNPIFGFVHILPNLGSNNPTSFRVYDL